MYALYALLYALYAPFVDKYTNAYHCITVPYNLKTHSNINWLYPSGRWVGAGGDGARRLYNRRHEKKSNSSLSLILYF